MHRHAYAGRKLSRSRDQRKALLRGLATNLVEKETITTTMAKAKELAPYAERLVSQAKRGGLQARRQVAREITTDGAAKKLVEDLGPRFKDRNGGYVSVKAAGWRKGDQAAMATVSLTEKPVAKAKPEEKVPAKPKPKSKAKAVAKKEKA